jgi:hypothetical protein
MVSWSQLTESFRLSKIRAMVASSRAVTRNGPAQSSIGILPVFLGDRATLSNQFSHGGHGEHGGFLKLLINLLMPVAQLTFTPSRLNFFRRFDCRRARCERRGLRLLPNGMRNLPGARWKRLSRIQDAVLQKIRSSFTEVLEVRTRRTG